MWNDNVWNKVIAGLIVAGIVGLFKGPRGWVVRQWKPKVMKVSSWTSEHTGATFPLKHYVLMKNDSRRMMDVRLASYDAVTITLKRFATNTLQIQVGGEWCPVQHGAERLAILPGQYFRAWVGVDESKFTKAQVDGLAGKIGKLSLKVNWRSFSFDL